MEGEMAMKRRERIYVFVMATTFLGVMAPLLVGCAARGAMLNQQATAALESTETKNPAEYRIHPGDQMDIKFFFNPELNETVLVRPDGKISLQLIDDVQAAGLTATQLDEELTRRYAQELRKPAVTVIVRTFTGRQVYVGGEVGNPGLINLGLGMTALQAVINAGGFKDTARPGAVIVIRKGPDNRPMPVRVDLDQALDTESAEGDFPLQPQDIVYVPRTWIAQANLFVKQYIQDLILYRGISLGFGYQINPDTRR